MGVSEAQGQGEKGHGQGKGDLVAHCDFCMLLRWCECSQRPLGYGSREGRVREGRASKG
jgi:hypothetical protein